MSDLMKCLRCDEPVTRTMKYGHGIIYHDYQCGSGHAWTVTELVKTAVQPLHYDHPDWLRTSSQMEDYHESIPSDSHCPYFGYGADD